MKVYNGLVERVGKILDYLAGICLVSTMLVVIVNILMRGIFHDPLLGTMEYVNILTALTVAFALAYCAYRNGQIAVDLLVDKMPKVAQAGIDTVTSIIGLIFWAIAAYYMADYGRTMTETGLVSSTTSIPMAPVAYLIAICLFALSAELLNRTLISSRKVFR